MTKAIVCFIITLLAFNLFNVAHVDADRREIYSTVIYLLAVGADGKGYVVKMGLKVKYPGSGSVTIYPSDLIDDSVKSSISYSLVLTRLLTGFNHTAYDYEFVFETNKRLEGLSGTLPIVLTLLSFVKKIYVQSAVGATGLVTPHGSIGLVGGLDEKYHSGRQYGLENIIGPRFTKEPRVKYTPVLDIFTAFRRYANVSMYGEHPVGSLEPPGWLKRKMDEVFMDSFKELHSLLNRTIVLLNKLGVDHKSLGGYTLINKSLEYYRSGNYYTASSYAFRAYVNLTTTYLVKFRNESFIEELVKASNETLTYLGEVFRIKMEINETGFWNIDALINAYSRYVVASEAFNRYLDTNDVSMIVLSHARALTSKFWLNLYVQNATSTVDEEFVTNALREISVFCNHAVEYLSYIYPDSSLNDISRACSRISEEVGLRGVIEYWKILMFIHEVIDLTISEEIYSKYINLDDVNELLRSIKEMFSYVKHRSGEDTPQFYATTELSLNYIRDGEPLGDVTMILLDLMMHLSIYIFMINSNAAMVIHEEGVEQLFFAPKIPAEIHLAVSIVMITTGSLIMFTTLKTKRSRVTSF